MAECQRGTFRFSNVIRGHHIYKAVWMPYLLEELSIAKEESNAYDRHAVVVLQNDAMPNTAVKLYLYIHRTPAACAIINSTHMHG